MAPDVAAFTDTYLPTVNGVTYTVETWRDRYRERGNRMAVVYPSTGHTPRADEHPVPSAPFPFYDGFRFGVPRVPATLANVDLVHAHTPFGVGYAGVRLADSNDLPLVASYHTPTGEYAEYLAVGERSASLVRTISERYERWFFEHADLILAPSTDTRTRLVETVGVGSTVEVLSNGVDVERFRPVETAAFRRRHGLPEGDLVGYTGRHGYEKRLGDLIDAVAGLDATLVLGGDGPARPELEARAERSGVDARFLGFLDREELPAFYSMLDVFGFPSPVETQGLVALEANACGTPVVAADAGALADTVADGETGFHYTPGDADAFRAALERAIGERETLAERCLDRRDAVSVEGAVDRLESVYERLV
jgi:glycosyltransferase involved in cell wall biosynthesis